MASKTFARLLASSVAGVVEIYGFHPLDTVVKRLQMDKSTAPRTLSTLNATVFRDAKDKSLLEKYSSLMPGFGFAVTYKGARVPFFFKFQNEKDKRKRS